MGLERLIQAAQGTRMSHTNIGGNAFEALMGAIYLDRGFRFCHWFIANRVIGDYIDLDNVAQKEVNFKSKLLEWSQKNRININFKDVACEGEGKGFKTVITIEGIVAGRGAGRSKKRASRMLRRKHSPACDAMLKCTTACSAPRKNVRLWRPKNRLHCPKLT